MFGGFVHSVPFALGGASCVECGAAAAEADGSVEGVGFGVGLGGWREEEVEEEDEDEDGGHGGGVFFICRWEMVWGFVGWRIFVW